MKKIPVICWIVPVAVCWNEYVQDGYWNHRDGDCPNSLLPLGSHPCLCITVLWSKKGCLAGPCLSLSLQFFDCLRRSISVEKNRTRSGRESDEAWLRRNGILKEDVWKRKSKDGTKQRRVVKGREKEGLTGKPFFFLLWGMKACTMIEVVWLAKGHRKRPNDYVLMTNSQIILGWEHACTHPLCLVNFRKLTPYFAIPFLQDESRTGMLHSFDSKDMSSLYLFRSLPTWLKDKEWKELEREWRVRMLCLPMLLFLSSSLPLNLLSFSYSLSSSQAYFCYSSRRASASRKSNVSSRTCLKSSCGEPT